MHSSVFFVYIFSTLVKDLYAVSFPPTIHTNLKNEKKKPDLSEWKPLNVTKNVTAAYRGGETIIIDQKWFLTVFFNETININRNEIHYKENLI